MKSVFTSRRAGRKDGRPDRAIHRLAQGLRAMWHGVLRMLATYFPPHDPQPSPPLAKAAAPREGALLSEHIEVRANKNAA